MSCDPVALYAVLNEAENAIGRAMRAARKSDFARVWTETNVGIARAKEALAMCHDDVPHEHPTPTPTPTPPPTPTPAPVGEPFADIRYEDWIAPAGAHVDKEGAPEGAFRFTANIAKLGQFDPIVYPGQDKVGHLHQFWGNVEVNPNSTHASLCASGASSVQGNMLNRSAYWTPVLLLNGKAWLPDWIANYYKLHDVEKGPAPASMVRNIPVGLKMIFGNEMMPTEPSKAVSFDVFTPGFGEKIAGSHRLADVLPHLKAGYGLIVSMSAPNCWNGELDSADHRSHLAYTLDPYQTYERCPESHPYLIPQLTLKLAYTVPAGMDGSMLRCSTDMPGQSVGLNFHADYIEAWHPRARDAWFNHALLRQLNCSACDFGDGTIGKAYPGFTFEQRPNLVEVPV